MPRCASNIDPSIQMLVPCGISSSASSVKFIVKRFGTFPTISEGSTLTTVGHRVKVAIIRQTACSPFLCYLPYMRRCLCCSYGLPWLSEKVSIPRRASQEFGQLRGPQNPRIAALVPDRGDPGRAWKFPIKDDPIRYENGERLFGYTCYAKQRLAQKRWHQSRGT